MRRMLQQPTGLVLSGGGVRGAYEVGVVQGIVEALGLRPQDLAPFQIFSGTSVGAINAAYLAANAQRGDLNVGELAAIYRRLDITQHLRVGMRRHRADTEDGWISRAFIDPRPLELLVRRSLDWDGLHHNIGCGLTSALIIAAFNLLTGQTTIFSETAHSVDFRPSMDSRKVTLQLPITADHVLASAAIPLLFPARKVGDAYYCDGGVRFNTPISPAIRAGAERLVIVSLQSDAKAEHSAKAPPDHSPSTQFIAGRLLNALLIDPFQYDLAVLQRLNRLMEMLEEIVPAEQMERIESLMEQLRGEPYRKMKTLVIKPSEDLGRLANEHLRRHLANWKVGPFPRYLLKQAALEDATWEADWAAYLMFDGDYAGRLIELGLGDARRRASEIQAFFSDQSLSQVE